MIIDTPFNPLQGNPFQTFQDQSNHNIYIGLPQIIINESGSSSKTPPSEFPKKFTTKKQNKVPKIEKAYYCSHKNCSKNPKTMKQKINHHDKIDRECRREKKLIIKLLIDFEESPKKLLSTEEKLNNSSTVKYIKYIQEQYIKAKHATIDKEQFNALIPPLSVNVKK